MACCNCVPLLEHVPPFHSLLDELRIQFTVHIESYVIMCCCALMCVSVVICFHMFACGFAIDYKMFVASHSKILNGKMFHLLFKLKIFENRLNQHTIIHFINYSDYTPIHQLPRISLRRS